MDEMSRLWRLASTYGRVTVYTLDNGMHCGIKFNTIVGTSLESKSTPSKEPETALREAIANCVKIIESFNQTNQEVLNERKRLTIQDN